MSEKPRQIIQSTKLRLSAKPIDGGKPPQLVVDTFNQNPQITVWTGAKTDPNSRAPISARLDPVNYYKFLNMLLVATASKDPCEYGFKNEHKPKDGNKTLVSNTLVGRDENGVWICIEDADPRRPKIRFYFGYDPFHSWIEGKEIGNRQQQSNFHAKSWVETLKVLFPVSLAGECSGGLPQADTPFNKGNNNRSNGNYSNNNRNGGSNGGYSQGGGYNGNRGNDNDGGYSNNDDDDDLPI